MDPTIALQSTLVAVKEQVSADLSGEVVILNMRNGEYFGLNSVGAAIWELLQEPRTIAEVRDLLLEMYPDADRDRCTQDLLNLATQLADAQLVEVESGADSALRPRP